MSYFPGPVSPDGRTLVVVSESDSTPHQAPEIKLHLLDVSSGPRSRCGRCSRSPTTGTAGPSLPPGCRTVPPSW